MRRLRATQAAAPKRPKTTRRRFNRIFQTLALFIIFDIILFGCAGHLDWWEAWACIAISLLGVIVNAIWPLRHDPELINERGRAGKNAKSWDKVLGVIYTFLLLSGFAVAGLDARYAWSAVPLTLKIIGIVKKVLENLTNIDDELKQEPGPTGLLFFDSTG